MLLHRGPIKHIGLLNQGVVVLRALSLVGMLVVLRAIVLACGLERLRTAEKQHPLPGAVHYASNCSGRDSMQRAMVEVCVAPLFPS